MTFLKTNNGMKTQRTKNKTVNRLIHPDVIPHTEHSRRRRKQILVYIDLQCV